MHAAFQRDSLQLVRLEDFPISLGSSLSPGHVHGNDLEEQPKDCGNHPASRHCTFAMPELLKREPLQDVFEVVL